MQLANPSTWWGVYREALKVASRAHVPLWKRLAFAFKVAARWSRNSHSLEEAVNHALSQFMWKRIG